MKRRDTPSAIAHATSEFSRWESTAQTPVRTHHVVTSLMQWVALNQQVTASCCLVTKLKRARKRPPMPLLRERYFAVGITNSAPLPMLSGQRCMMLFCFV